MSTADDRPRDGDPAAGDTPPTPASAAGDPPAPSPAVGDAPQTRAVEDTPTPRPVAAGDAPTPPAASGTGDTPADDASPAAMEGSGGSPDTVDRAAAPYPWLAFLARNRWQVLALLWVVLFVYALAQDGFGGKTGFSLLMAVLFTAAAAFEFRGRRRTAARRAAGPGDPPVR